MDTPEIRYIAICRDNLGSLHVDTSSDPVIVTGRDGYYIAKLETYPKVDTGMVAAVRFPDGSEPLPLPSEKDRWLSVQGEDGPWWIFAHQNPQSQQFESEMYNRIGRVEVKTPTLLLMLEIESPDWCREDLASAVNDFKQSLLGLIAEKSSVFAETSVASASLLLTTASFKSIRSLVKALTHLQDRVKTRLSHQVGDQPVGRARLTIKGETQYLIAPDRRRFDSHFIGESKDTGENRFLLATAKQLLIFLKSIDRARAVFREGVTEQLYPYLEMNTISKAPQAFLSDYSNDNIRLEADKKALKELLKKIEAQGFEDLEKALGETIRRLKEGGVREGFTMANPMVFQQNPLYRDFYCSYRRLSRVFETVRSQREAEKAVGRISLTNLPNFYERWCLVKLFQVLIESFHFEPCEPAWRSQLLAGVTANASNMVFEMKCANGGQVTLTYQRKIQASVDGRIRYPDFTFTINGRHWVFDAKLRLHASHHDLMALCNELADTKDYAMGGTSPVFIIHSSPYGGMETEQNRSNIWRLSSYYGSDGCGFRKGHVFLSPERRYRQSSYDNLKRLILLILQENDWVVCPECGQIMEYAGPHARGTKFVCPHCSRYVIQTYCFSCSRRIWKNGWYWAYNEFNGSGNNVRCPSCRKSFTNTSQSCRNLGIYKRQKKIDSKLLIEDLPDDWLF